MDKVNIFIWNEDVMVCKYKSSIIPRVNEIIVIITSKYKVTNIIHEINNISNEIGWIKVECEKI
jgi:hypothetical protein